MNNEFEQQLSQLKLKPPSENYALKGKNLLNELARQEPWFKWSYLLAFCLMLSMAINWHQYKQPIITINQENLITENTSVQVQKSGYLITQGAMVPYGGNYDITIILEN